MGRGPESGSEMSENDSRSVDSHELEARLRGLCRRADELRGRL
jgi:hypothetical protein